MAIAKFRPWTVLVNGISTTIKVLSTVSVDLTTPAGVAGPFDFYDNTKAYSPGAVAVIQSSGIVGGVTLTPGVYGCRQRTNANATGFQVPQWPMPTNAKDVYWVLIALSPQLVTVCQNGSKQIYINASSAF